MNENGEIFALAVDRSLLRAGMRLAVGVSGGADSVALLLSLNELRKDVGLVLSVAHLHHGLRGAEADGDCEFVRTLAQELGLEFFSHAVDVAAEARAQAGKTAETIEEAARRLRYGWFRQLMAEGKVDAVATAHTLDDQAETVLGKFLRGAWTEGLSGIHPEVNFPEGRIIRPMLSVRRSEVESYLNAKKQPWCEDSSNAELSYTRNRIRHELLPQLAGWNPRLREHLAQIAELARDEEAWWQQEMEKIGAQLLLEGKPVRGGGRASGGGWAIDLTRFVALAPAVQRRLLRMAAGKLFCRLEFAATEDILQFALTGKAGQKRELAGGLRVERTNRELRFALTVASSSEKNRDLPEVIESKVPGLLEGFGVRLRVAGSAEGKTLRLRAARAGDRVQMRYSSGPRKIKDVLERLQVSGSDRAGWPVLECDGQIVWMRGVDVEPLAGITIEAEVIDK